MNHKIYLLSLTALIFSFSFWASANMNNHNYTARDGAPNEKQFMANNQSDSRLPGITFLRPVMSGVLYRSGIGNSKEGLSTGQLEDLCQQGFTKAMIVDFKDGEPGTLDCDKGTIEYVRVTSSKNADAALKMIYNIIVDGEGPALAHCRNGVHASNVISAKALVRFCDWTIEEAKDYWEATRNKAPCSGGCDKWLDGKFAGFSEGDGGMPLTPEEKASFCPNP